MITSAHKNPPPQIRLKALLRALGIAASSWYRQATPEPKPPGPKPKPLDPARVATVVAFAKQYPWWGYRRLAIVLRRAGHAFSTRFVQAVFRAQGLFQHRKARTAELYQSAKLFELLPSGPNQLWQSDVTYLHIPGHGWWYAVTVIDYYSRYLLACYLTPSFSAAEVSSGLDLAVREAERLNGGPLKQVPFLVTDNGSSFLSKRFQKDIQGRFQHVRTRYRTPEQLGLLERFHQTLKREEVYWQLYDHPQDAREKLEAFRCRYNLVRPHWALVPKDGGDVITPIEVYHGGAEIQLPKWQGWAKAARARLETAMAADAELKAAA